VSGEGCTGGDCCSGYCNLSVGQCDVCYESTNMQGNPCVSSLDCCGITCVGASREFNGFCQCGMGTENACQ
jgi:hypothetical protein